MYNAQCPILHIQFSCFRIWKLADSFDDFQRYLRNLRKVNRLVIYIKPVSVSQFEILEIRNRRF